MRVITIFISLARALTQERVCPPRWCQVVWQRSASSTKPFITNKFQSNGAHMKDDQISLFGLTLRTIVSHTLTYFLIGLMASVLFNYAADFARPELRTFMRQIGD